MNAALAASIASLLLAGGCNTSGGDAMTAPSASADVAGVRDGQTELRVGQTLMVSLPSNATTGYQWQVDGVEGGMLNPATPFGVETPDDHPAGMVGVGGVTHWRMTAARPGTVTLTFTYRRSWERDTPPAETATYRIVVR